MGLTANDFGCIITVMEAQHAENYVKLQDALTQLDKMAPWPRHNMAPFVQNIRKSWTALDSEFVNCRRSKRITAKYAELEQKYCECITVFEQWSIMAALMF